MDRGEALEFGASLFEASLRGNGFERAFRKVRSWS
jgi:hypothetical protein